MSLDSKPSPPQNTLPLCVDLDGTLIKTDLLFETAIESLRRRPFSTLLHLPGWFLRGRAYLKRKLAEQSQIHVGLLPYSASFLAYLRAEFANGRKLYLVTAADSLLATRVATHLGLFAEVLASDGTVNLAGHRKAELLLNRFGAAGFDYAGNARADLPIWAHARRAIVVNPHFTLSLRRFMHTDDGKLRSKLQAAQNFSDQERLGIALARAIRPHQWVKNILIFIPLLLAHRFGDGEAWLRAAAACLSFCLCASAVYLINDLSDLEADRTHPVKRLRPLAAGDLTPQAAIFAAVSLLAVAFAVGAPLDSQFSATLLGYLLLSTAYSLYFKQQLLLDVVVLATLFSLRLFAGAQAIPVLLSNWLLIFSLFIFFSLAFAKRYLELSRLAQESRDHAQGRAYRVGDLPGIGILGIASGFISVVVLGLYVTSDEVTRLYSTPQTLLLICPLLLYWIARFWLLTMRGAVQEDPIVFAIQDIPSYAVGALASAILYYAL